MDRRLKSLLFLIFCLAAFPVVLLSQQDEKDEKEEKESNPPGVSDRDLQIINSMEAGLQAYLGKLKEAERKNFEEVLKKCEAATVRVVAGKAGEGSGVLVAGGKYIATAGHGTVGVGGEGGTLHIILPDGRNFDAKVVKHSLKKAPDIGVAEVVNPKGESLPSLELGSATDGAFAMVIGYPRVHGKDAGGKPMYVRGTQKGSTPFTLVGKVSQAVAKGQGDKIGFSPTVNAQGLGGNSGGPIISRDGKVMGIFTHTYNTGSKRGKSYGTSVSVLKQILQSLEK